MPVGSWWRLATGGRVTANDVITVGPTTGFN